MTCLLPMSTAAQTRVISYGSNPYFSYDLFPQDIANVNANCLSFYPSYCKAPWWGDIDEILNKPKATYTTTGSQVTEGDAYFKESSSLRTTKSSFGYTYRPIPAFTTSLNIDYALDILSDVASGNFTGDNFADTIPFEYDLNHTKQDFRIRSITSFNIRDIPFGIRLNAGRENTVKVESKMDFTKGSNNVSTERALWGWSTVGCNHIFGIRGTQGDAWFQDNYSIGPLYILDLQIGTTLPKGKFGAVYHNKFGRQDNYQWRRDTTRTTGDSVVDRNFIGYYEKSKWIKKNKESLINLYGNINLMSGEMFGVHSFVSLAYNGARAGNALSNNSDIENDSKEFKRGFMLEFDPNITIKPGPKFHYIDIAVLFQYGYNRYSNKYMRWVGGGRSETFWDTEVYSRDEDAWENYSYANENFMNTGIDISTLFPIFDNQQYGHLGFGFTLLGEGLFTFQKKYYGRNTTSGSSNQYTVSGHRHDYIREVRFHSMLMLDYIKGPLNMRLQVTEPALQSILTKTEVTDASDKQTLFKNKKDPLWMSNKGLEIGMYVAWNLHLPFLKYRGNPSDF
jgi:hypothetical protein